MTDERDDSEIVAELLLHWERARQGGDTPDVDALCANHLEFKPELLRRIKSIERMEGRLGVTVSTRPQDASDNAGSSPPADVPGYEIECLIDRGGAGLVFKAVEIALQRTVALKMLAHDFPQADHLERFRREAEAIARLQHPNIVHIHAIGDAGSRPYYAMEFIDGGTLADQIRRRTGSPRETAELVSVLARAIENAHQAGIVHRDLKPSNILMTIDGTPKIGDFGLAKHLDVETAHTRTGDIIGTPAYMSPEQAGGDTKSTGAQTDIHALGTILYEMLTGSTPFPGRSAIHTLQRILTEHAVFSKRSHAGIPQDLQAICLKCLEKRPQDRYSTAADLADDLDRFLSNQPVTVRSPSRLSRMRRWVRRHPAWSVTLVLAVAELLFLLSSWRQSHAEALAIQQRAIEVAPQAREVLERNCAPCHGLKRRERELDVLDHRLLLDSNRRLVVASSPESSRLIQRIEDGSMPPEEDELIYPRVSQQELVILQDWIAGGAPAFGDTSSKPVVEYSALAMTVKQIFHEKCYNCHRYDVAEGGIKILHHRLLTDVRRVVVPGDPSNSELMQLLTQQHAKGRMPPIGSPQLSPEQIEDVRFWIELGAPPFPMGPSIEMSNR
ncbi:MAG: protein kinase [Planctomycetota bacterium]|nr:protein kinase [Planctomycetota bacterium]